MALAEVVLEAQQAIRALSNKEGSVDAVVCAFGTLSSLLQGHQRATFLDTYAAIVLEKLLCETTELWAPFFNKEQRLQFYALLDAFPPDVFVISLCEALAWAAKSKTPSVASETFLSVRRFSDQDGFFKLLTDSSLASKGDVCEQLAGLLVSLPDRVANLQSSGFKDFSFFLPNAYFAHLGSCLARALLASSPSALARLVVGRASGLGHASLVLQPSIRLLKSGKVHVDVFGAMILVPDRFLESICVVLLKELTPRHRTTLESLACLLLSFSQHAMFLFSQKLVFSRWFLDTTMAIGVSTVLQAFGKTADVLSLLASVWGTRAVLDSCSYDQHLYMTKLLLLLTRCLAAEQWLMPALSSIPNFIQANDARLRALGLATAVLICQRVAPARPLQFEVPDSDDIRLLRRLTCEELDSIMPSPPPDIMATDALPTVATSGTGNTEDPTALAHLSIVGPDAPLFSKDFVPAPAAAQRPPDLDSDDDFEPFAMPAVDKDPAQARAAPRYVRECLALLSEARDVDKVTSALRAVAPLARRQREELQEIGASLALVLVGLPNEYNLPDYTEQRRAALTAIVAGAPAAVGPLLAAEFYSANWTTRQRLDILQALIDGAFELSKEIKAPEAAPRPAPAEIVLRPVVPVGRTRRFASASKPVVATANAFAAHAAPWFVPLAHGLRSRPKFLSLDFAVLAALLRALAIIVRCARSAAALETIAVILLEICTAFRSHEDVAVRCAALCGLITAVMASPAAVEACALPVDDISVSLVAAARDDPSPEGRELARACLAALHRSLAG